jgi:hypothetical protein
MPQTNIKIDYNNSATTWFERSVNMHIYYDNLNEVSESFHPQRGDTLIILGQSKPYHEKLLDIDSVKVAKHLKTIDTKILDQTQHYTAQQQQVLAAIKNHCQKMPYTDEIEYYTVNSSEFNENYEQTEYNNSAIAYFDLSSLNVKQIPQTNDQLTIADKKHKYNIASICWVIAKNKIGIQLRAYLICEPQLSTTAATQQLFINQPWARTSYKKYRDSVMRYYNSNDNISRKAQQFAMDFTRIRSFREDYKTRMVTSMTVDVAKTAAVHFMPIPLFAVHTIWSYGVGKASNYIYKYFSKTLHQSAPKSKLQEMVYTSEFKFEEFSRRLNFIYWEVMNAYEKLINQSNQITMSNESIKFLVTQNRSDDAKMLKTTLNNDFINNYSYNYAVWDGLREEALEYATFLQNITQRMQNDLELMTETVEAKSANSNFEHGLTTYKSIYYGYRKPIDLNSGKEIY